MSRSRRGGGRPRRVEHEEPEEHENHERWLVSYADMVTVLMALFIVMYAMSTVDQAKFDALKSGLAEGFGLTVAEAIAGATSHAARALGLHGTAGVIAAGARADLVVWDADHPAQIVYWVGLDPVAAVVKRGRFVVGGPE